MTVKELISILSALDPDIDVILQKDSEGNGYSPLADVDSDCIYLPDSTWSGEVVSTRWSSNEACMSPDDWEEFKNRKRSVVLSPVN